MKFSEVIEQASALLQRKGRISYRTLQREFALDDEALEDLKIELIEVEELARDKDGKMLVWTGEEPSEETTSHSMFKFLDLDFCNPLKIKDLQE